ncbi:MAG TPA: glycerate kinase [Bacillota bacterium]|nr:glycerate kinase [Bacillota bacterium]
MYFKGTMSAFEVCGIMRESIYNIYPECEIISVPIADGGEGTVDCFLQAFSRGRRVDLETKGPFFGEIKSFYGIIDNLGIIEMAASAGVSAADGKLDPEKTSTYGVGELINDAIGRGCKKIILGLGGSCTNDAGAGMAAALGAKFYDRNGRLMIPVGGNLASVAEIDITEAREKLKGIEVDAMCDIDNPLYGESGAAYVFGPQKGADPDKVKNLDRNLRHFSETIYRSLGIDVSGVAGAGAAGGMGAGAYAFLGARLKRGIDVILDIVHFEEIIRRCDCILTGEGKLDAQSMNGKAVIGISRRAKPYEIPVVAVVGSFEGDLNEVRDAGVSFIFETGAERKSFEEIKVHCRDDLRRTMDKICREWTSIILNEKTND